MVSDKFSINALRSLSVPILGMIALAALFLKLPEIAKLFSSCKSCNLADPYMPLIGCGYFGLLIALALLFPAFPSRILARGGLVLALSLAFLFTSLSLPSWCPACLIAHGCNILIWSIWVFIPSRRKNPRSPARLYLALFAPISMVALFSSINLTFMAYGFKNRVGLRAGDPIPIFTAQTVAGRPLSNKDTAGMIFNFVAPDCPYCKEQMQMLRAIAPARTIVNISSAIVPELMQDAPNFEWVEDRDSRLQKLFQIVGFPTLYVVGSDEKIAQVILGVPERMHLSISSTF